MLVHARRPLPAGPLAAFPAHDDVFDAGRLRRAGRELEEAVAREVLRGGRGAGRRGAYHPASPGRSRPRSCSASTPRALTEEITIDPAELRRRALVLARADPGPRGAGFALPRARQHRPAADRGLAGALVMRGALFALLAAACIERLRRQAAEPGRGAVPGAGVPGPDGQADDRGAGRQPAGCTRAARRRWRKRNGRRCLPACAPAAWRRRAGWRRRGRLRPRSAALSDVSPALRLPRGSHIVSRDGWVSHFLSAPGATVFTHLKQPSSSSTLNSLSTLGGGEGRGEVGDFPALREYAAIPHRDSRSRRCSKSGSGDTRALRSQPIAPHRRRAAARAAHHPAR